MKRRVVLHDRARRFLRDAYRWWAENRSAEQAERWNDGFLSALDSLGDNPERWPVARENTCFPFEVREFYYGLGSRPTHRALFTIRPEMIFVLVIRHMSQKPVTPDDL